MPSETGIVHVIDDDEALRDSLAFLLRAADLEVMSHASAAAFLDVAAADQLGLHHHRRADAGA